MKKGKFLLDDPVSKYLPEFKDAKVYGEAGDRASPTRFRRRKQITIRDLLRHTSGLTYNWNADLGPMYEKANVASGLLQYDGTIGDSVKHLADCPCCSIRAIVGNTAWASTCWAGWWKSRLAKPLDEFFRTRIFEPLGMKDSYFYPPDNKLDRLATAYTYYADKGLNRFPDTPIREDGSFVYSADYPSKGRRSCSPAAQDWSRLRWITRVSAR